MLSLNLLSLPWPIWPSLRSVEKIIHEHSLTTTRRNGLTRQSAATAVSLATQEDPLGRKGKRAIQEQLSLKGIHIARFVFSCSAFSYC